MIAQKRCGVTATLNDALMRGERLRPARLHARQEHREQTDRRQIRADLIDELDRSVVGELAERNPNETVSIIRSWLHEGSM